MKRRESGAGRAATDLLLTTLQLAGVLGAGRRRAILFLAAVFLPLAALGATSEVGAAAALLFALFLLGLPWILLTGSPAAAVAGSALQILVLAWWVGKGKSLKRLIAAIVLVYAYLAAATFIVILSGAAGGL